MTKASKTRAQKKILGDLANYVPEDSLTGIANQFTDLIAMANETWHKQYGSERAATLVANLLAVLSARFLIQLVNPLTGFESLKAMTLTQMLGCLPDVEQMRGEKLPDLETALLQAGATVPQSVQH